MRLGISRWQRPLSFLLSLSLVIGTVSLTSRMACAQSVAPSQQSMTPGAMLSMFPQLQQNSTSPTQAAINSTPSVMATSQTSHSPLNNKVVPYDSAMKELKQRDTAMPKPVDIETIIPTKNSPLFKGGVK